VLDVEPLELEPRDLPPMLAQWWVCAVAEPDPAWECAVADDDGADDGDDDGDGVPFDVAADAMPAPPAPRPAAITPVTKSRRATP